MNDYSGLHSSIALIKMPEGRFYPFYKFLTRVLQSKHYTYTCKHMHQKKKNIYIYPSVPEGHMMMIVQDYTSLRHIYIFILYICCRSIWNPERNFQEMCIEKYKDPCISICRCVWYFVYTCDEWIVFFLLFSLFWCFVRCRIEDVCFCFLGHENSKL